MPRKHTVYSRTGCVDNPHKQKNPKTIQWKIATNGACNFLLDAEKTSPDIIKLKPYSGKLERLVHLMIHVCVFV